MKTIDLRSDTVTLPTKEMIDSISIDGLGDDVEREDSIVNELQDIAAKMFGAEDALLVPSGTGGNLIAMLAHCQRGDEIILEQDAHMYYYEVGGMSALVGAIPRLVKGHHGVFTGDQVREAVRSPDPLHYPPSKLVEIENTHNRAGGCVWTPRQMEDVARAAHELGMKVHVDGARIFNAAIALDIDPKEFMRHADSLDFCLSKGLASPVGSIMLGSKEYIESCRRFRKMVGGGMRQAGIIAAPGIVALTKMVSRLKEDHVNAKRLALALIGFDGIDIDMESVQTNIVIADVSGTGMNAEEFVEKCRKNGILIFSFGPQSVRFVTHYGIESNDINETVLRLEAMLR
ncbi:MAG TPA: GntG family PLP-dependent aldolase [Methanomassiliicoccales archaeon]|jgi:threonine aldolase